MILGGREGGFNRAVCPEFGYSENCPCIQCTMLDVKEHCCQLRLEYRFNILQTVYEPMQWMFKSTPVN